MARRRSLGFLGGLGGPFTRISLIILIVIAFIILVLDRARPEHSPFLSVKPAVAEKAGPVMNVLSAPLRTLGHMGDMVKLHWQTASRVRVLEQENRTLLQWRDLALAMHEKMQRYEELLNAPEAPTPVVVTARTITDSGGPFVRARLINVGTDNGVRQGQAVVAHAGMIGRVMSAGRHTSRVLLLNDLNSRIPVFIDDTGFHAILAGDNSAAPRLVYIGREVPIVDGMRVMTSGEDGVLPRGLAIGHVVKDLKGNWRVLLNTRPEQADFVSVLQVPAITYMEDDTPNAEPENTAEPQNTAGPQNRAETANQNVVVTLTQQAPQTQTPPASEQVPNE